MKYRHGEDAGELAYVQSGVSQDETYKTIA
jgi:hypothetical protein